MAETRPESEGAGISQRVHAWQATACGRCGRVLASKAAPLALALGVLVPSLVALGLLDSHMEVRVEKLWVQTGGRLDVETAYVENNLPVDPGECLCRRVPPPCRRPARTMPHLVRLNASTDTSALGRCGCGELQRPGGACRRWQGCRIAVPCRPAADTLRHLGAAALQTTLGRSRRSLSWVPRMATTC